MKRLINLFTIGLFLATFAPACVHLTGSDISDETILKNRINRVWEAKLKKDWNTVYDLCCLEYKQAVSRKQFLKGANLEVVRFEITDLQIFPEEKRAEVTISFDITYMSFQFKDSKTKEQWVWEDGNWFLKLKPLKAFPK